jgi:hypothetical protein
LYNDDDDQPHSKIKSEHFKDVKTEFVKHRFIICSPSVGAGIDFSEEHFDIGIHLYVNDGK